VIVFCRGFRYPILNKEAAMHQTWIKLYVEILHDPKMESLPAHLWRRAIEMFLFAGDYGKDGLLPPVPQMAWTLRMSPETMVSYLKALHEIDIVDQVTPEVWVVKHFASRQAALPPNARLKNFRTRQASKNLNQQASMEDETESFSERNGGGVALSTSSSPSPSDSGERVQGEGVNSAGIDFARVGVHPETTGADGEGPPDDDPAALELPSTALEAAEHPEVRLFQAVTGRIPGAAQYAAVIDALRLLRRTRQVDNEALAAQLQPYWEAWTKRKRRDGQPYDPGNITWLTEWALNGRIPPEARTGNGTPGVPGVEETRRMLAARAEEFKRAVPPPQEVRDRLRALAAQMSKKPGKP
jgi:hypothetical protein